MKKIKVLIVDDSVVFRSQIRTALEGSTDIEVVGVAANGRIAIDKMRNQEVDLVTLDLDMPEMNGLETLREMRRLSLKTKAIVFSAASVKGAQITMEALEAGAIDFVSKPNGDTSSVPGQTPVNLLRGLLGQKILDLFPAASTLVGNIGTSKEKPTPMRSSQFQWRGFEPQAILIGCSTGGPGALELIFSKLRGPFRYPVLITQHMPPIFTASLAARLEKLCQVPAAEGKHNEMVQANRIYVAPGNYHMQVVRQKGHLQIQLNQDEQENSVRPAVDQMFRSAAQVFHQACLGFILTGMGQDGLKGAQILRESSNPVIIQDRESCVVFGMPGAVHQAGAYDDIQNLEQITETMGHYLMTESQMRQVGG